MGNKNITSEVSDINKILKKINIKLVLNEILLKKVHDDLKLSQICYYYLKRFTIIVFIVLDCSKFSKKQWFHACLYKK